jgi:hypothetical protein
MVASSGGARLKFLQGGAMRSRSCRWLRFRWQDRLFNNRSALNPVAARPARAGALPDASRPARSTGAVVSLRAAAAPGTGAAAPNQRWRDLADAAAPLARRDDPPALRAAGAAGAARGVNTEAAGEPDSVLRPLGPTRGVARRACSGDVPRCRCLSRRSLAKGRGRRGHEWRQAIPGGCLSVGRVDAANVRTRCSGVSPLRRAVAARRADRAGVGGATHLATPRSAHRGPRGAASAGATAATRNRGSVPGRSRIRRRLLRALRRARRGVGVRRRFSSRSAFPLLFSDSLDENRLHRAALSALSKGEGLSRDRERALCELPDRANTPLIRP